MPTAIVEAVERTTDDDGKPVVNIKADPGGGALATYELALPPGVDALPLKDDAFVTAEDGSTGGEAAVAFHDTKNAGKAAEGEHRVYGRSPDGAVVNEWWLKGDGSVVWSNVGGGKVEMAPDGTLNLNGVTISPQGEVRAPLEITAMSETAPVKLSTHVHLDGMGGTAPPTPGS